MNITDLAWIDAAREHVEAFERALSGYQRRADELETAAIASLRALTKAAHPNAVRILFDDSDQDLNRLTFVGLKDADGVEIETSQEFEDEVWRFASSLTPDNVETGATFGRADAYQLSVEQ